MLNRSSPYTLSIVILMACSHKPGTETQSQKADTIASIEETARFLDLDTGQYQIYDSGNNTIILPESDLVGAPKDREPANLLSAEGVERQGDQLTFALKNGQQKVLRGNLEDEENSVDFIFTRSLDAIGYWEVLAFYYESFDYILINQTNGSETHLWNKAVLSPDNKYLLCGSVDLEAAFVPNGFQLWSVENDQLSLRWAKEIEHWGAERLLWTNDNYVWGEQTYRDQVTGELEKRLIKMRMFLSDVE